MNSIREAIEEDAVILLERALLGKTVNMFGQDGNGQYGRDHWARFCKVTSIQVRVISMSDDMSDVTALAFIYLDNYHGAVHGHAMTDQNLRISMDALLKAQIIDPKCLSWADLHDQFDTAVVMKLNIGLLMDWA